jgi:hypothetical protein
MFYLPIGPDKCHNFRVGIAYDKDALYHRFAFPVKQYNVLNQDNKDQNQAECLEYDPDVEIFISKWDNTLFDTSEHRTNYIIIDFDKYEIEFYDSCFIIIVGYIHDGLLNLIPAITRIQDVIKRKCNILPEDITMVDRIYEKQDSKWNKEKNDDWERQCRMFIAAIKIQKQWRRYQSLLNKRKVESTQLRQSFKRIRL